MISEDYSGSDLSGIEGASNRTLTISNSRLTIDDGLQVFVDGYFLHPDNDFTIVHNSSSSVITFLNAIFDSQKITVIYEMAGPGGDTGVGDSGVLPADTQLLINEIDYIGESVTVRSVSRAYSDYGDVTETNTDTNGVKCIVNEITPEESKNAEGIFIDADKRFFFKGTQSNLTNGNKIIYDSKTYEIVKVNKQTASGTTFIIEVYGKVI